jgi:hypothetical protein
MTTLAGGKYITFEKPYLNMVVDVITSKEKLIVSGKSQVINITPEIKKFIKAVSTNNSRIVEQILKPGSQFAPLFNGWKWSNIDKSQFTQASVPTDLQELGSLFAIQKSIENNGYNDREKFFKLYMDDLLKIYPDMNELWEETYFQQQMTVQKKVGKTPFKHYSRDGGFMEYISKKIKVLYGISQKDTWNPADIWLVSDLSRMERLLDKVIVDDVTSLEQFNQIMRDLFHKRKIVGISLKKMSGKSAKWELVNLENMDMYDTDEYSFKLEDITLDFSLKSKSEFKNSDTKIVIGGKRSKITTQIRQNSAGFNNLKIEGTAKGATSARLGKAPLQMVSTLFKAMGLTFDNKHQNYPRTADEYVKTQKKWEGLFKKFIRLSNNKKYTDISKPEDFSDNMITIYNSNRPDFASSKLMQLKFITEILRLKDDDVNLLLTSLTYLQQKKGKIFGPFGKLY